MTISIDDAFVSLHNPETGHCLMVFWSSKWFTKNPWTYAMGDISYICKRVHAEPFATITSYFFGPLCFVAYKTK